MRKKKYDDQEDFLSFVNSSGQVPSDELSSKVLNYVKSDLKPSHLVVFRKLVSVQAFIAALTLLFCPQFDFSLTNSHKLFNIFHELYGKEICMIICGAIFIGSGATFAAYILKESEIRIIKNHATIYYFSVSILLLSPFLILGPDIYLGLTFFWLLGACLGGVVLFNFNTILRVKIFQSRP